MRQISAEIDQADWLSKFHQRQLVAWQTRMICSWMVKLNPDMSPEQSKEFMAEAGNISLDSKTTPDSRTSTPTQSTSLPSRKDFYGMEDEEIEKYLGVADNPDGSFEKLLGGFGRR